MVGRFLEHSRIYSFGEGALRQIYISSADIMTRNQVRRVEVACPVRSREVADFLGDYLERILSDNVKARRLLSDGTYAACPAAGERVSVQQYYLDHPPVLTSTREVRPSPAERLKRLLHRA